MNQKRFRRLYCEEGLQVRKRGGRKRALGLRAPLALPSRPNERWSLDRLRHIDGWPPVPGTGDRRRLHTRMPRPAGGHLALGRLCCARARRHHRGPGQADDVRFRQWHGAHQHGDPGLEQKNGHRPLDSGRCTSRANDSGAAVRERQLLALNRTQRGASSAAGFGPWRHHAPWSRMGHGRVMQPFVRLGDRPLHAQ